MSARRCRAAAIALVALLATFAAAPVRAGTEEFSTFSVEAQEEDDESLIDHMLTRTPHAWAGEWERAPQALRSARRWRCSPTMSAISLSAESGPTRTRSPHPITDDG